MSYWLCGMESYGVKLLGCPNILFFGLYELFDEIQQKKFSSMDLSFKTSVSIHCSTYVQKCRQELFNKYFTFDRVVCLFSYYLI